MLNKFNTCDIAKTKQCLHHDINYLTNIIEIFFPFA